MSFDGLVTGAVARQLQNQLVGGKIEKIYQPEEGGLVLHIHLRKEKYKLYISANSSHARIHLSHDAESNPANPSGFCMLLRKHLQGGRIASVLQKDSDRILEISVNTVNELGFSLSKKLIVEIMGKHSNIILLDVATGKIADSIKRVSLDVNRYRQILPGQPYLYPPDQNKQSFYRIDENELEALLANATTTPEKSLVLGISGVSPLLAQEIASLAEPPLAAKASPLAPASFYPVLSRIRQRLLTDDLQPTVYLDENQVPKDFYILPLKTKSHLNAVTFEDISSALAYFYEKKTSSNRIRQKSADLEQAVSSKLDKLYLKKQRLLEDLDSAEKADVYRLYGELLTANLHEAKSGATGVTVLNYYNNENLNIPLDPRFSPSKNAQRYYKKYAKAKTAIKEKHIQLEETARDTAYLESVLTYIESALTFLEIEEIREELTSEGYLKKKKNTGKVKKSKPAPYSYITSDGFQVLVGRNNKENDFLTLKLADRKDYWFHTKDIPGSHVILITKGKAITETAIRETAALAAYHSKSRESENVPVDYTQVRFVKKPSGAKPGMVIFTDNKTVYATPAQIATT